MAESASFQRGSPGGKKLPMSPAATEPSSASVMACSSTSPSEWPARPSGWSSVMPPMRSGTPGLNACESQPNPIRVSMVSVPVPAGKYPAAVPSPFVATSQRGALAQVKLGQLQIAGLRNLQINLRTVHHGDRVSGALHHRGFVGANKAVRRGLGEDTFEQAIAEALRGLRQHHELARNGGCDQRSVRGALHLLDGVHGGQAHDGRSVLGQPHRWCARWWPRQSAAARRRAPAQCRQPRRQAPPAHWRPTPAGCRRPRPRAPDRANPYSATCA